MLAVYNSIIWVWHTNEISHESHCFNNSRK